MREPRYTYKAASPCFSIEHEQPFVLKGCSCGWPATHCLKWHGRHITVREKLYQASIEFTSPEPQEEKE